MSPCSLQGPRPGHWGGVPCHWQLVLLARLLRNLQSLACVAGNAGLSLSPEYVPFSFGAVVCCSLSSLVRATRFHVRPMVLLAQEWLNTDYGARVSF